jgi:hypothetical protein
MNRKLLVLDIALGIGVIYGGFQLHSEWAASKARQANTPGTPLKPAPAPNVPPLPTEPAVLPSDYKDVAIKDLFDPSRNPNIPIDAPPPPPPPPPDPVPPPFPSYHGSMDLGEGPVALLTPDGETRYQEVHIGGMIGPFKLLAFDRQEIQLEWNGHIIHKRASEKSERAAKGKAAAVPQQFTNGVLPGQAQEQLPPPNPNQHNELPPGEQMTDTVRSCQPGDTTPAGTIVDNYRKEVIPSPLGASQCIWRAVGK